MFDSQGMLRKPDPESSSKVSADGPFFTVLVPTMNRANLLAAAVRTVMWQTFEDFELIVSDNSNDDQAKAQNRAEIEKYASDPRVHYISPDTWMNMPDHWEFASRHASGRYVVILTDRHVMRPSALEFLHSQITQLPKESGVVCWHDYSAFLEVSGLLVTKRFTGRTETLDSKKVARSFATFPRWRSRSHSHGHFPHSLNSCYRFDIAQRIRREHSRLFNPISPDDTSGLLLLAYSDQHVYCDRPLFLSHGRQGNGRNVILHGQQAYLSQVGKGVCSDKVPLPFDTIANGITRDVIRVKDLVGARFSDVHVDWVGYYLFNYSELLWKERLGSPMDIGALYEQWWNGVGRLTPEQQTEVKEHVKELEQRRASFIGLRRLVARMGLGSYYHSVMGSLKHVRQRLAGKPVYADVFEAAEKSDYVLTDSGQKPTP